VPQKASSACKHCHNAVNHHSHPEKAEKHLNNCEKFTKKVYGGKNSERPPWFVGPSKERDNHRFRWLLLMRRTRLSQTNQRKKSQKFLTSFFTKQSPGLTKEEQQEIDDNLAMFCYCSGSSFRTLENPHLQKVLEICRPDVVLPTRQKLAGEL